MCSPKWQFIKKPHHFFHSFGNTIPCQWMVVVSVCNLLTISAMTVSPWHTTTDGPGICLREIINIFLCNPILYALCLKITQFIPPVDRDQPPLRAVSRDAMLPVAVCDVQGTVVAGLRECVVEFHVEGVGALHGRSPGDTDAVTRVLPR